MARQKPGDRLGRRALRASATARNSRTRRRRSRAPERIAGQRRGRPPRRSPRLNEEQCRRYRRSRARRRSDAGTRCSPRSSAGKITISSGPRMGVQARVERAERAASAPKMKSVVAGTAAGPDRPDEPGPTAHKPSARSSVDLTARAADCEDRAPPARRAERLRRALSTARAPTRRRRGRSGGGERDGSSEGPVIDGWVRRPERLEERHEGRFDVRRDTGVGPVNIC